MPQAALLLRWLLALAVMTPFVLPAVIRHRDEIRRQWPKLALLGLLGMGLWQGLAYVAAETTTATNMGILAAMVPLLTVLLSALILREPPTLGGVLGGVLAFVGVTVLLGRGNPLSLLQLQVALGDALMVVAATCYALYGVMLKRWSMNLPPWVMLYAQVCFAVLFLLPPYLMGPMTPIDGQNIGLILYAGIPASIITTFYGCAQYARLALINRVFYQFNAVVQRADCDDLLGERVAGFHFAGGLLILAGVIMAQTLTRPLTRELTSDKPSSVQ